MRRPLVFHAMAVGLVLAWAPLHAQPTNPDSLFVRRVASLADLYGAVFYFHPDVASDTTLRARWDSATAATVEKVLADSTDFQGKVSSLLSAVHDPGSQLVSDSRSDLNWFWIVSLKPDGTAMLRPDRSAGLAAPQVLQRLRSTPRMVIDLREAGASAAFVASGLANLLADSVAVLSQYQAVWYRGYPPDRSIFGGNYRPYVAGLGSFRWRRRPTPSLGTRRVVFLLSGGQEVPPEVLAIRSSGRAAIVSDGPVAPGLVRYRARLTDGLAVDIRMVRLVPGAGSAMVDTMVTDITEEVIESQWSALPRAAVRTESAGGEPALPAHADSWPPLPPRGARVLAAYRIWNAAVRFFPYAHLARENWNQALVEALPQVFLAATPVDYATSLARLSTRFHDSHALIEGESIDAGFFGNATPGIGIRFIESRPIVVGFSSDSVRDATGLRLGDEIEAVDGQPASAVFRRLASVTPTSTPQALENALAYRYLAGPSGSRATLRVQGADGMVRSILLTRQPQPGWFRAFRNPGPLLRTLAPGIGYVDLTRLPLPQLDSMFAFVAGKQAVVLDLRGYPDLTAYVIAPRLSADWSRVVSWSRTPLLFGPDTTRTDSLVVPTTLGQIAALVDSARAAGPRMSARVVVLVDARTQSRGEWSAQLLQAAGAILVGSPTSGVNGDITFAQLPGGLQLRFTGLEVRLPNGGQLQRRGLRPEILVRETIAGFRAGRDEPLEAAVGFIQRTYRVR